MDIALNCFYTCLILCLMFFILFNAEKSSSKPTEKLKKLWSLLFAFSFFGCFVSLIGYVWS